jgi:hypothetical protein
MPDHPRQLLTRLDTGQRCSRALIGLRFPLAGIIMAKTSREDFAMPIHAERRHRWDYGPGLWGCCFGGRWRRPSRRERTEALKDYIAELKEELQDAEECLKDLEK